MKGVLQSKAASRHRVRAEDRRPCGVRSMITFGKISLTHSSLIGLEGHRHSMLASVRGVRQILSVGCGSWRRIFIIAPSYKTMCLIESDKAQL